MADGNRRFSDEQNAKETGGPISEASVRRLIGAKGQSLFTVMPGLILLSSGAYTTFNGGSLNLQGSIVAASTFP